jgi:peptidyl-prolyl cis-trans isomerase A (cyclophilin A)
MPTSSAAKVPWPASQVTYVKPIASVKVSPDDPVQGKFSLDQALARRVNDGSRLVATISTSLGDLTCDLFYDRAPITVANFVGLANGTRPWRNPQGLWASAPMYEGVTFHRVIKGFMIQGGDPTGLGSFDPGYVIPDEIWEGSAHDRAGLLCMANRGPDTGASQFFITDAAAPHLDAGLSYTIFGECGPIDVVHHIASTPVAASRPVVPVVIQHVGLSISR